MSRAVQYYVALRQNAALREEPQSARWALKSVALTSAAPKNAGLAQTYAVRQNRRRHRKSHRRRHHGEPRQTRLHRHPHHQNDAARSRRSQCRRKQEE
jgi:hypothetical protein